MSEAHRTLAEFWQRAEDPPLPAQGAEATMRAIEQRYGLTLPEDFRDYLLHAAPAEDYWDDSGMIWWKPGRIQNIPDEYDHAVENPDIAAKAGSCLFFADYMIWCWAWAICCEDGPDRGKVVLIGSPDRWVADSFTDFLNAYLADPEEVAEAGSGRVTARGCLFWLQAAALRAFASFLRIMSRFSRDR